MAIYRPTRIALIKVGDLLADMLTVSEFKDLGYILSHTTRKGLVLWQTSDLTVTSVVRNGDTVTIIAEDGYGSTYERSYIGRTTLAATLKG